MSDNFLKQYGFDVKDELCPLIWDESKKLKEDVLSVIKHNVLEFLKFLKIPLNPKDVILIGSIAGYNWSKFSDIDIHVLVDIDEMGYDKELISEFFDAKKSIWNEKIDAKIKGFEIEFYIQDVNEKNESQGIYSIVSNKWIQSPSKSKEDIDQIALKQKIQFLEKEIDKAIESDCNLDCLNNIRKKIRKMRKSGLQERGEFSIENLAFKALRRNGYIEKLLKKTNELKDKELSLESIMDDAFLMKESVQSNISYINVNYDDMYYDEEQDFDIHSKEFEISQIVKNSGINILRDKELEYVAYDSGNDSIAGMLYYSLDSGTFSFDIIVADAYKNQGIGKELTDIALSDYNGMYVDQDIKIELDVVNKNYREYLKKKGFVVKDEIGDHSIMVLGESVSNIDNLNESIITEVRYEDFFGEEFVKFRRKYSKMPYKNSYYVQFTNNYKDPLEKTPHQNPDHSDPVGIYGYPLSYVLNNPSDIWYGSDAKYLRVLKDVSKNKLVLNDITDEYELKRMIRRCFPYDVYSDVEKWISIAKKIYKDEYAGGNKLAKIFMICIRFELNSEKNNSKEYPIRKGIEQTKLLRNAGFDAIEDMSKKSSSAIINDREPEQIIFLNRYSFSIEEIYTLHERQNHKQVSTTNEIVKSFDKKIAARIADIISDSIIQGPDRANKNGWSWYWTKKGRRIMISFDRQSSYYNGKKIGEKKHKENKLYNKWEFHYKVISEYEKDLEGMYDAGQKFDSIFSDIMSDWVNVSKGNLKENWRPLSKNYEKQLENEMVKKRYMEKEAKEMQEELDNLPITISNLQKMSDKIRYDIVLPKEYNMDIVKLFRELDVGISIISEGLEKSKNLILKLFDKNNRSMYRKYQNFGDSILGMFYIAYEKYHKVIDFHNRLSANSLYMRSVIFNREYDNINKYSPDELKIIEMEESVRESSFEIDKVIQEGLLDFQTKHSNKFKHLPRQKKLFQDPSKKRERMSQRDFSVAANYESDRMHLNRVSKQQRKKNVFYNKSKERQNSDTEGMTRIAAVERLKQDKSKSEIVGMADFKKIVDAYNIQDIDAIFNGEIKKVGTNGITIQKYGENSFKLVKESSEYYDKYNILIDKISQFKSEIDKLPQRKQSDLFGDGYDVDIYYSSMNNK